MFSSKDDKEHLSKSNRNSNVLELVHSNVYELSYVLTRGGKRYFIIFINDFSRFTYMCLMRNKDESFDMFKCYKIEIENQKDVKVMILRSDRGGKYFPNDFSTFCEEHDIIHQNSIPYASNKMVLLKEKIELL